MWQLDAFFLDQVFQPIANRFHQWFGITPIAIGEFFAAGSVVVELAKYIIDHPGFPFNFNAFTFTLSIGLSCLLAFVIIYPQGPETQGVNIKRYTFFALRMIELCFLILDMITLPLFWDNHWWSHVIANLSWFTVWLAVCFVSLSMPPPRRFKRSTWVPV